MTAAAVDMDINKAGRDKTSFRINFNSVRDFNIVPTNSRNRITTNDYDAFWYES